MSISFMPISLMSISLMSMSSQLKYSRIALLKAILSTLSKEVCSEFEECQTLSACPSEYIYHRSFVVAWVMIVYACLSMVCVRMILLLFSFCRGLQGFTGVGNKTWEPVIAALEACELCQL